MKVSVLNELGCTELIIEEEKIYEENYQMTMLRECKIPGLVSVIGCGMDDSSRYMYNISGMQSLAKVYEKMPIDEYSIRQFTKELLGVLEVMKYHMLDINHILLDPEYIFKQNDQYYLCYYPLNEKKIKDSFHELSQYFVQHIDYGEVETVILACGLHKSTMEEDYDLTELLQEHSVIAQGSKVVHEAMASRELSKEVLWENLQSTNIPDSDVHIPKKEKSGNKLSFRKQSIEVEDKAITSQEKEFTYGAIKANPLFTKVAETSLSRLWNKEKASPDSKDCGDKNAQKKKETWGDWDALLKQEGYR